MTRIVTGIVLRGDETPFADTEVVFRLVRGSYTAEAVYPPSVVTTQTDEDGAFSVDLWPNSDGITETEWMVVLPGQKTYRFVLPPSGVAISLMSLLISAGVTDWTEAGLTDAMDAFRAEQDTAHQEIITDLDALPGAMRLASVSSLGASLLTVRTPPNTIIPGMWIVPDPYSVQAEPRQIASYDGSVITLLDNARYTATTIGFTAPNTITDTSAGKGLRRYSVGDLIRVQGSSGNSGLKTVNTVGLDGRSLVVDEAIVTEAAGPSITLGLPLQFAHSADDALLWRNDGRLDLNLFGGRGDGTTDNTAAINAAVRTTSGIYGSCIFLSGGVYLVNSMITLPRDPIKKPGGVRNIRFEGIGKSISVIEGTMAGPMFTWPRSGADDYHSSCEFSDLTLRNLTDKGEILYYRGTFVLEPGEPVLIGGEDRLYLTMNDVEVEYLGNRTDYDDVIAIHLRGAHHPSFNNVNIRGGNIGGGHLKQGIGIRFEQCSEINGRELIFSSGSTGRAMEVYDSGGFQFHGLRCDAGGKPNLPNFLFDDVKNVLISRLTGEGSNESVFLHIKDSWDFTLIESNIPGMSATPGSDGIWIEDSAQVLIVGGNIADQEQFTPGDADRDLEIVGSDFSFFNTGPRRIQAPTDVWTDVVLDQSVEVAGSGPNNGIYTVLAKGSVGGAFHIQVQDPLIAQTPFAAISGSDISFTAAINFVQEARIISASNAFADVLVGMAFTVAGSDDNDGLWTVVGLSGVDGLDGDIGEFIEVDGPLVDEAAGDAITLTNTVTITTKVGVGLRITGASNHIYVHETKVIDQANNIVIEDTATNYRLDVLTAADAQAFPTAGYLARRAKQIIRSYEENEFHQNPSGGTYVEINYAQGRSKWYNQIAGNTPLAIVAAPDQSGDLIAVFDDDGTTKLWRIKSNGQLESWNDILLTGLDGTTHTTLLENGGIQTATSFDSTIAADLTVENSHATHAIRVTTKAGTEKFGVYGDGKIRTNQTASASTPGTVTARMPIYNASGTLVGYIPIYDAIT